MAKTLSNNEIEHVLSSIRDLVSEVGVTSDAVPTEKPSKLILTPQHRVDDAACVGTDEKNPDYPTLMLTPNLEFQEEPATYESGPVFDSVRNAPVSDGEDEAPQEAGHDAGPKPIPPLQGERDRIAENLENRIAELEEAVARSQEDWEPDGSEEQSGDIPGRKLFEVFENKNFYPGSDDHVEGVSDRGGEAPLRLADVAKFTHVPSSHDHSFQEENLPFRNVQNVDFGGNDRDPLSPIFGGTLLDDDDDLFIDEEVLRRVVRDVVQKELQGKLGERMTRNLRRMVRREIERSLSIREIE